MTATAPTEGTSAARVAEARVPGSVAVLAPFVDAGIFAPAEVHLAATVARLAPGTADEVLLGLAVAARGTRLGHICVALDEVATMVVASDAGDGGTAAGASATDAEARSGLPWPDLSHWSEALAGAVEVVASPADATATPLRPLVFDGTRLYLQRYWCHEVAVADALLARAHPHPDLDPALVEAALTAHFGPARPDEPHPDLQRRAAEVALRSGVSVIAGGPGTGKTTTVAKLLLCALELQRVGGGDPLRVALAAPTGKAAARMTDAIGEAVGPEAGTPAGAGTDAGPAGTLELPVATTIHRLLGWLPGTEFRHHAGNPLDADLVIVDETSMVDLALMARLLDAVRPDARLVLVGDPHQLASVEAGTVLGDLVAAAAESGSPLADHLTVLTRVHRFAEGSAIAALEAAVRSGDPERVVSCLGAPGRAGTDRVDWVGPDDVAIVDRLRSRLCDAGVEVVEAAREPDSERALEAAGRVKLLAAVHRGPTGLRAWSDRIEAEVARRVAAADPDSSTTLRRGERWYVGRPILVTANDALADLHNGDVGVVVARAPDGTLAAPDPGDAEDGRCVAIRGPSGGMRHLPPARLDSFESWWAMTIHKSQGSEFPEVIVSLPAAGSPILTRELLYTAVTRARERVTIVASEEAIRAAVDRPVTRASGLRERLGG